MAFFDTNSDELKARVASLAEEMSTIKISINEMRQETELITWIKYEVGKLVESVDMLKNSFEGIDETLRSMAKNVGKNSGDYLDKMMKRTKVLKGNEVKVTIVKKVYEKLDMDGEITSSLMKYLLNEPGFEVWVDCDSRTIGNMKKGFVDNEGMVKDCHHFYSLADCDGNKLYLGAMVDSWNSERRIAGHLANSMAVMIVNKVYGNMGRPYLGSDTAHRAEYQGIIKDIFDRTSRGDEDFNTTISWAAQRVTRSERETQLIAVVPQVIAHNGFTVGSAILMREVPELLKFYKEQVLAKIAQTLKT